MRAHSFSSNAIISVASIFLLAAAGGTALRNQRQTLAPHELRNNVAPGGIEWPTPLMPKGPIDFESAEQRHVRLVVMSRALEQPWSMAFLPDGSMLVTERPGRLRVVRHGVLDPTPVQGVPAVQTGGEGNLQGLMDVVLHPRFAENHWIYLVYHKPTETGEGATTLARGTWTGTS